MFPVRSGYGIAVLSTPKGLLSDKEAKKEKVGGEIFFEMW
jgi:small subunit ribosomal protein S8